MTFNKSFSDLFNDLNVSTNFKELLLDLASSRWDNSIVLDALDSAMFPHILNRSIPVLKSPPSIE